MKRIEWGATGRESAGGHKANWEQYLTRMDENRTPKLLPHYQSVLHYKTVYVYDPIVWSFGEAGQVQRDENSFLIWSSFSCVPIYHTSPA